jgi:hypothetical protein
LDLAKDTVAKISNFAIPSNRNLVFANGDADGWGFFRLIANSTSFSAIGSGVPATWKATIDGAGLTGTTGTDGDTNFGLEANGDLYVENRQTQMSLRIGVLG